MKTTEIAIRSAESIQLGIICDLLNDEFEYADNGIIKKISEKLELIMNEVAKPIQDKVKEDSK